MPKQISKKMREVDVEAGQSKGQVSRATILQAAAKLATTSGLIGLSIGDLAAEVGMSKSGLYAHFKSKEELELATIETAIVIFTREVLEPGNNAPAGVRRLKALFDAFLTHLEQHVFPGGCFFASVSMELDTHPGAARDRVVQVQQQWFALLRQCFVDAQNNGEIVAPTDVEQAVFETESLLLCANFLFVLSGEKKPLQQAQRGLKNLLARLAIKK